MKTRIPILFFACLLSKAWAGSGDLANNLDSKIRIKVMAYPQSPGDSDIPDDLIEDSTLTTEFMYRWATWMEIGHDIRFDTTGWIEYGMPNSYRWKGGAEFFQDEEIKSRPLVPNELYATIPIGGADVVLGRTIQRNTMSILYPLADRYVARDFNDPMDPKILGIWQMRANLYAGNWQFSAAALPVFQPPKVPGIESRWWIRRIEPITGQPVPPGATGSLERNIPSVGTENTGILATVKTRQRQWDAFSTVYYGYTPYPVTRVETPSPGEYLVTLDYLSGFEWSGGVSTTMDAWELHSEALYHHSSSGADDDFINALAGFIWRPYLIAELLQCNQIHLIVEYAGEYVISRQAASSGYVSSSKPFRTGRNTLFSQCLFEISDRNTASISYIQDFHAPNAHVQLRGGHRFGNGVYLSLIADLFSGENLYFGSWKANDRIYLNYEYNF